MDMNMRISHAPGTSKVMYSGTMWLSKTTNLQKICAPHTFIFPLSCKFLGQNSCLFPHPVAGAA